MKSHITLSYSYDFYIDFVAISVDFLFFGLITLTHNIYSYIVGADCNVNAIKSVMISFLLKKQSVLL